VECEETTKNMTNYMRLIKQTTGASSSTQELPETSDDLIDLNFDLSKLEPPAPTVATSKKPVLKIDDVIPDDIEQDYLRHNVRMTDTVRGLALKYNVLAEEIKVSYFLAYYNTLFSD
jgi:hypothetical protein